MYNFTDCYAYTDVNGDADADEYPSFHIGFPDFETDQDTYSSSAARDGLDSHTYPDPRAHVDAGIYTRAAYEADAMAHANGHTNADPHTRLNWNSGRTRQNNALIITRRR